MVGWRFALFVCSLAACGGDGRDNLFPDARSSPARLIDARLTGADAAVAIQVPDARTAVSDARNAVADAPADPCQGVPASGVCASATSIRFCVVAEGEEPELGIFSCQSGTECALVDGQAQCVPAGTCANGSSRCANGTQLQTCVNGAYQTSSCPRGCLVTPLGDACAIDEPTHVLSATLSYEARGPNDSLTDWGPVFRASAQGFLIVSVRYLSDGSVVVIDATTTGVGDAAGQLAVRVADTPQLGDRLLAFAVAVDQSGLIARAVLDPELAPGTYATSTLPSEPSAWSWYWRVSELSSGDELFVPEGSGSGAARVFDYLRFASDEGFARWPGRSQLRLLAWFGHGVSWAECGSCFGEQLAFQLGSVFGGQVWLNGDDNEEYWADAVTAHELGHWAMASYGRSVGEGGIHYFGQVASPGLAWSEGWATWFSSDLRQDPLYFDKQSGTTFWFDISDHSDSDDTAWPRPSPSLGLYQPIYEDEISAMMWNLSDTQGLTHAPLDAALASGRMTIAPFLRGYFTPTGQNTTFFADFLDALECIGVGAASIDAATQPQLHYPYPSASPLCAAHAPEPPAILRIDVVDGTPAPGARLRLRAHLERQPSWTFPVDITIAAPRGFTVATLPRKASAPDDTELDVQLGAVPTSDLDITADSRSPHAGFHAVARYRFGRPEPVGTFSRHGGPRLHIGGRDLGVPLPGGVD